MRSLLLIARIAFVAALTVLAVPSGGSAAPNAVTVVVTATGPSPSVVRVGATGEVLFVNRDSVAHTVVVRQNAHARWTCPLGPAGEPPSGSDQCVYGGGFVSRHSYSVDGRFPGEVVFVGLPRSVSLTARTHAVALGSPLTLHGQITFESWPENQPQAACNFPFTLLLLNRHDRSEHFKRIATFRVKPTTKNMRATNNLCAYVWQRSVRPGVATTYMARVIGVARICRLATSRPFTVAIRP